MLYVGVDVSKRFPTLVGRFARIDSRCACEFSASQFLLQKNRYFANQPSRKWIAARTGRESCEFECESERRRDSRESGQVLQTRSLFANRFARIHSCESAKRWCANRRPTKFPTDCCLRNCCFFGFQFLPLFPFPSNRNGEETPLRSPSCKIANVRRTLLGSSSAACYQ